MSYKPFAADDIVTANATEVTVGLWPGETGSLALFYTGSDSSPVSYGYVSGDTSGQYYWDIFNLSPTSSVTELCFSVAYGDRTGRGHPTLTQDNNSTLAPQAVYSQYRNLLLDPGDTQFSFYGGVNSDNIYVINVSRDLFKERVDAGNWQLTLSGSRGKFTFIDDSGQAYGSAFGKSGQVYNIVSGSLSGSLGTTIVASGSATQGGYGLFYPSLGIMVFNPAALSESIGFRASAAGNWTASYSAGAGMVPFAPYTGSCTDAQYNHASLVYSIRGGASFQARSAENISSTHFFVRLRAAEYNYSNNPTYFDESTGALVYSTFINDPVSYVTTIGLYNDNNELLAVAKTSQPIKKSSDTEVNLKVRLDY